MIFEGGLDMEILSNYYMGDSCNTSLLLIKINDDKMSEDICMASMLECSDKKIIRRVLEELSKWFYSSYIIKYDKYSARKILRLLDKQLHKTMPQGLGERVRFFVALCDSKKIIIYSYNWSEVYYFKKGLLKNQMHSIDFREKYPSKRSLIGEWEAGAFILFANQNDVREIDYINMCECLNHEEIADDISLKRHLDEIFGGENDLCGLALIKK